MREDVLCCAFVGEVDSEPPSLPPREAPSAVTCAKLGTPGSPFSLPGRDEPSSRDSNSASPDSLAGADRAPTAVSPDSPSASDSRADRGVYPSWSGLVP